MRRSLVPFVLAALLGLGPSPGCSDDDGGSNNNTSEHLSPDFLSEHGGAPDYTCVGEPDPANSFGVETEISGIVEDFEEGWEVGGVIVHVFASLQDLLDDSPFDSSAPSSPTGEYTVSVPSGVSRFHFKMQIATGTDYYDTIEMNEPIAGLAPSAPTTTGKDRLIVSAVTMETVPAILGIARLAGTGIIAGKVYDCNRMEVEYAAQRAYDSGPENPNRTLISVYEGASRNSFYFGNGMPVRNRMFTDVNGQFIIANVPYSQGNFLTMEMWGRLQGAWLPTGHDDCTEGCLISIQDIPVMPDTIIVTDMNPLYAN